jgi:hypothetical protein
MNIMLGHGCVHTTCHGGKELLKPITEGRPVDMRLSCISPAAPHPSAAAPSPRLRPTHHCARAPGKNSQEQQQKQQDDQQQLPLKNSSRQKEVQN